MLKKWCCEAYCDGVRDLYASRKKPRRFFFWCCVMLLMLATTGYFIWKIFQTYRQSPSVIKFSIEQAPSIHMPEVLLCYNGGLNASALKWHNFSFDLLLTISGADGSQHLNINESKSELDSYLHKNGVDVLGFYETFGYICQSLVKSAYVAGSERNVVNIACTNKTRKMLSPFYGICYLYENVGTQLWPGLNGGVKYQLISPSDSLVNVVPDIVGKTDRSHSFVVSMENEFTMPTYRSYLVPMSMKTEIVLNAKHLIRLKGGPTRCNANDTYSSNDCFNRCFAETVYQDCRCVPFRYYQEQADTEREVCTPFDDYFCIFDDTRNKICQSKCVAKCDEWIYESTISYSHLPAYSDSQASLWIGYTSMQFTKIEEVSAYTMETAIANVGAQVGLWMGCSVVTVVQAFYYFLLFAKNKWTNKDAVSDVKQKTSAKVSVN